MSANGERWLTRLLRPRGDVHEWRLQLHGAEAGGAAAAAAAPAGVGELCVAMDVGPPVGGAEEWLPLPESQREVMRQTNQERLQQRKTQQP